MKPFITFREEDDKDKLQYYILQRAFPHFIGVITEYPVEGNWSIPITRHHLWVTFEGALRGNFVPSYRNVEEEIAAIMNDMALWFYDNRILKEPKKYKKWLFNPQSTT